MYLSTFGSIYSNIADMNMEEENDEAVEYAEPLDGSLLDVSVNEEVKETFECDICGGHYSTKANLKRHLKKHEDPAFECKKCTQYFPSAAELTTHQEAKHSQKNELCITCGKAFAKKAHLPDHQRSVHEQNYNLEARLACPYTSCTRKFLTKEKFQDHVNGHTGVKPFSCTVCSKDFHSRYYKSKHEKVCTGETSTMCETCGKSFCDSSSLKPCLHRLCNLFATDFFATDWRSMRLVQPFYAHIRIEDYNRRLVGDRFATGLRLTGDWSP